MKLSSREVNDKLENLMGWELVGNQIKKEFDFKDFKESLNFVNQVAELAEEMDHHPDILIQYNRVLLSLSTHSAGGLTEKDFTLAGKIDRIIK